MKKTSKDGATLTVAAARRYIGEKNISLNSLYRAVDKGHIPSVRLGGKILIPKYALQKLMGEVGSNA